MARDHARLDLFIWSDEDFRALSVVAKTIYMQLFSQPKLTYAGVLDLAVKRWARAHPDLDIAAVRAALSELDAARFVVIDQDTEELLVRSFIRRDELYKQPMVLRGALRCAFDIESPLLRKALAVELRRLPVEITGPGPAVAASELETGARELPASVKAAMSVRGTGRPAPAACPAAPAVDHTAEAPAAVDQAVADKPVTEPRIEEADEPVVPAENPSPNPSANPSGNPSRQAQGEGSRERETGVVPLALRETKVGVPAPPPAHEGADTRERARTREAVPAAAAGHAVAAAELEYGSARQSRRVEAERLVSVHCPAQPQRVLDRLRGEVIGLLRDGIESAVIAAGLRLWAGKTLAVSYLPELVGELMRAQAVPADAQARRHELDLVQNFERIRADAIAEDDDRSVIGRAVRSDLPAHADAAALHAILDRALAEAAAAAGFGPVDELLGVAA